MQKDADYWIRALALVPHPEGGHFRETWRSRERIDRGQSDRSRDLGSAIYFLLAGDDFSAFHRLTSDEIWHFYAGNPLTITMITPAASISRARLGPDPERSESLQIVVPAGVWFAASGDGTAGYSLVGCTNSPGFEYADWEVADRASLTSAFPEHREAIMRLTRSAR
jgi:predicted cupin superfamily sugar epimerase